MRQVIVAVLLALLLATVCGLGAVDYTITPRPYGAIVWEQTLPENARAITDYATKAVKDVFLFWGVSTPVPQRTGHTQCRRARRRGAKARWSRFNCRAF